MIWVTQCRRDAFVQGSEERIGGTGSSPQNRVLTLFGRIRILHGLKNLRGRSHVENRAHIVSRRSHHAPFLSGDHHSQTAEQIGFLEQHMDAVRELPLHGAFYALRGLRPRVVRALSEGPVQGFDNVTHTTLRRKDQSLISVCWLHVLNPLSQETVLAQDPGTQNVLYQVLSDLFCVAFLH